MPEQERVNHFQSTGRESSKSDAIKITDSLEAVRVAGAKLSSIRDREPGAHVPFSALLGDYASSFNSDQKAKLAKILSVTQEASTSPNQDGIRENRGRDLQEMLPRLKDNPELLDSLYNLATSDTFLGRSRLKNQEYLRADFLIDIIRNTNHPDRIVQGPGSLCTAGAMLKSLDREVYLTLACEVGIKGAAKTEGGKLLVVQDADLTQSLIDSEVESGSPRSVRPSAGSLAFLEAVIDLGVPLDAVHDGAFWWEYTDAWRNLTGQRVDCYAANAQIGLDRNGKVTDDKSLIASSVTTIDYVKSALRDKKAERFLIDTEWNNSGAYFGASGEHARHMLVAQGVETRVGSDGKVREYLVCDNPIGKFVDQKRGAFHGTGSVFGVQGGFQFEVGEGSKIYIPSDVVERHLKTVLIEWSGAKHAYRYEPDNEVRPIGVGDLDSDVIRFVDLREHKKEEEKITRKNSEHNFVKGFYTERVQENVRSNAKMQTDDKSHHATVGRFKRGIRGLNDEENQGIAAETYYQLDNEPLREEADKQESRSQVSAIAVEEKVNNPDIDQGKPDPTKNTVTNAALGWGFSRDRSFKIV